eukprot:GEZU01025477.1.p1 GENE.GEZU01025477.1~~GEZU01025477.1.p1  ORF type:complete len:217 (-),score=70.89 GEZU01025477.1:573-1223(-)
MSEAETAAHSHNTSSSNTEEQQPEIHNKVQPDAATTSSETEVDEDEQAYQFHLKLKEEGTAFFKNKEYERAKLKYEAAVRFVDPNTSDRNRTLYITGNLNCALCHLHLSENLACIEKCDLVIAVDPSNAKAYFRRGMAYMNRCLFDEAEADFVKATELMPEDKMAQLELAKVRKKRDQYKNKEKQMFKKMFGTGGDAATEEETTTSSASPSSSSSS